MPDIIAFNPEEHDPCGVCPFARALGRTLRLPAECRHLKGSPEALASAVITAMDAPRARVAVLPNPKGDRRLVRAVIARCAKPVLLVPPGVRRPSLISRVLVPLDGTVESAAAVADAVGLFSDSGADIVVLHVVDESTVPRFWDQPVHARKAWEKEFLARYSLGTARLELRHGNPGEGILDVAVTEHPDLIALGWGRNLAQGRAATVRSAVTRSVTPILLLPGAPAVIRLPDAGEPAPMVTT